MMVGSQAVKESGSRTMYKPLDCLFEVKKELCSLPNYQSQSMWLCCKVLNLDSAHMLLNSKDISVYDYTRLMEKARSLKDGYPLQYLVGSTQFMGLEFQVRENVLIPRNDTEPMTEMAIKHIGVNPMRVLDLCCGSGCIGLSIKYYCPRATVVLGDISDDALELTRLNAKELGVAAEIVKTDMFTKLEGVFDVIVSNPPYIPTEVIPSLSVQVRHEPKLALDGDRDGLKYYRMIKDDYRRFLKPGGLLLLEIGHDQAPALLSLFGDGNIIKDLQGNDRILRLEKKDV